MSDENLKFAWSRVPTGIGIVTTIDPNKKIHGITINSFFSVSIKFPMIGFSISFKSESHDLLQNSVNFGFSLLRYDQSEYANFYSNNQKKMPLDIEFFNLEDGASVIKNSVVQFSCRVNKVIPLEDHSIFISDIDSFKFINDKPLLWYKSNFLNISNI